MLKSIERLPTPSKAELLCIAPGYIKQTWPIISHFIARAFESELSDTTFAETEADILNGRALLWVVLLDGEILAAVATQIWKSPSQKICSLLAMSGRRMSEWTSCISTIEKYAADEGCDVVRISGRPGWERVFRDYKKPWVTLEKRLR